MDKYGVTPPQAADAGDPEVAELVATPLLPTSFTATSTGSMHLVGMSKRKPGRLTEFESQFRQPQETNGVFEVVKTACRRYASSFSVQRAVLSNFPIVLALRGYSLLTDLPSDLIAGLTAGIMMIPQGLAFASLSTLEPIFGLYISLFSSLTYVLLGPGQQTSYGCIAILSIMLGSILDKYELSLQNSSGPSVCVTAAATSSSTTAWSGLWQNETSSESLLTTADSLNISSGPGNDTFSQAALDLAEKKLQVAGSVTLLCGLIFMALGKVGFGKLTVFMSDSLVAGVTVGAAFHVGSSQLKTIFGINHLRREDGIFKLMKLWFNIVKNIHLTNPASFIATAICILTIYLVKRFVNDKYKSKLRVPVPIELFVLVLATLVSYFAHLQEKFHIGIVGDVPVGVPMPRLPDPRLGLPYLTDGLIILVVAFAQSVSLAKLMGVKHNYSVDSDQEMFALGVVNVVCSVFSGYVAGASVSRTVVQDSAGGKTQVASLFAAGMVLLVMLFLGPYFYHVPKIALSAIIIVSLQSLVLQLLTIPDMWRKSRVDCLVFTVTVLATVVLDADLGLLVGVVVSVFLVLIRCMVFSVDVTAHIALEGLSLWRPANRYYSQTPSADVKVVRINFPLYFINAEIVTNAIFTKTGYNPLKVKVEVKVFANPSCPGLKKKLERDVDKHETYNDEGKGNETATRKGGDGAAVDIENGGSLVDGVRPEINAIATALAVVPEQLSNGTVAESEHGEGRPFSTLVLDLSFVSFVDLMGVKALDFVLTKYKGAGVAVYITDVSENCLDTLQKSGFMGKHGAFVFMTVDAVLHHLQTTATDGTAQTTRL